MLRHDLDRQLARLAYASVRDHTQLSGGGVLAAEEQAERARIVRMSSAFQRYLGGEVEWRTESRNEGSQQHGGDRASASPSPLQPRASDFRLPGLSPPWLGYPPAFLLSADVGVPQPLLLLHPRPSVRPGVHQDRRLHAVRHAGFRDVGKLRESAETACRRRPRTRGEIGEDGRGEHEGGGEVPLDLSGAKVGASTLNAGEEPPRLLQARLPTPASALDL